MTINRVTCFLVTFFTLTASCHAQEDIGQAERNLIQARINETYGNRYELRDAVASLGGKNDAEFTDPFGTLVNSWVFTASARDEASTNRGFIGIVRNGAMIAVSDSVIGNGPHTNVQIISTSDLNNDGQVDIVTLWAVGNLNPLEHFWIFSWDGNSLRVINSADASSRSIIIAAEGSMNLVDLDGDGVKELQGRVPDYRNEKEETVTYSWNGQLYGKWASPPTLPADGFVPRNRLQVSVKVTVVRQSNGLRYVYSIHNLKNSSQLLNEFWVEKLTNSFSSSGGPQGWSFGEGSQALSGWTTDDPTSSSYALSPSNQTDLFVVSSGPPSPLPYYAQGYNDISNDPDDPILWYNNVLVNSARGFTLGPSDPPTPLVPLVYIDTIASYRHQALRLGWIKNQGIVKSLDQKLENARSQLQKGNNASAKSILQAFINEVEALNKQGDQISAEAYALLKFNAEFLVGKLE
ncbi:MAG: hypothetical protein WEB37_05340 [Bacteroidota bacterium]